MQRVQKENDMLREAFNTKASALKVTTQSVEVLLEDADAERAEKDLLQLKVLRNRR